MRGTQAPNAMIASFASFARPPTKFLLVALLALSSFPWTHGFAGTATRTATLIAAIGRPNVIHDFSAGTQRRIEPFTSSHHRASVTQLKLSENDGRDEVEKIVFDPDRPVIIRGIEDDEISDEMWENVETGEPPKWLIMKELLGVNIFTYILAAAIALFLTLNFTLGPGWLGQALGMKGAGTFTDISTSLPDTLDLNQPDFLL